GVSKFAIEQTSPMARSPISGALARPPAVASAAARTLAEVAALTIGPRTTKCRSDRVRPGSSVIVLTYAWKFPSWPTYVSELWKVSKSQLPANVIAPPNGCAGVVGVPITVTCGPPTSVVPASGVATSTQASAPVTMASPLDVLTIELELLKPVPTPD